ncbi:hypothetical protein [endosymbiont of Ridgeia piscesae]|jgi:hypothetical protein|uniref:Uncharacterized protein n=1 Tax=endosymbiont of Ridgeia piscesae TaxID=54398 RepID=A0A0T5YTQ1_9GAMM|nr:hypothetical protein [endosymbiont of Ridgeia piscesae]KRT53999.1 hypothetical protein Ga0074115_102101 [endosymbiont of Ridgeia piscesae]KRT60189.1 hypothetical protein Ga0076813_16852 [endosymbiont of Ridgeia piscesae]
MKLLFSSMPGRYERHLMRKHNNPLFDKSERSLTPSALEEAQRKDHEELVSFIEELRKLVGEAVELGPHEQSDVILELKERLDKAYETACGLADEQGANKDAISKLVAVIMQAVWRGAGNDTLAHQELQQEEEARRLHYEMLEHPLAVDLLSPDSLISEDDLVPTLLSASEEEFQVAVTLFDPPHLEAISKQARALLEQRQQEGESVAQALERLSELENLLKHIESEAAS